jgi:hypothetical protein
MDGARSKIFPIIPLILTAVIIAGVIATSGAEGLSQSAATVIAIANMEVGAAPPNFEFARTGQGGQGQWTVMSDPTAFSGRTIEQSSTDRTDYRFPLAIFKSVVAKNIDVSARFKPVAGRVDQAGGIAVRVIDADNYYVVRANALEDNVRFYRVVKGRREQIDGVKPRLPATSGTARLKAQGERFTIEFDGKTHSRRRTRHLPRRKGRALDKVR